MKIGIDARLWNETGVGRYIRNLVWELQKIDHQNDYVLFIKKGTTKQLLGITEDNWKIIETDIHWHSLEEQLKFPALLNKENLDLMHFPYFSLPIFYSRPFVVTIHDLIINHFPTGKASTLPYPLYRLKLMGYDLVLNHAIKNSKKIIVPLEAVKEDLLKTVHAPEEKIVITEEGVAQMAQSQTIHKEKLGDYFLYVGNAYPHKNLERLIEAFMLFRKDTTKKVNLILVGKKDYFYRRLQERVKKETIEGIIFKHAVSDEELFSLYAHAVAFVSPSLMEGFGLPPLEAMKASCPVLLSDIPAFREVCQDSAFYFDPRSINTLKEEMYFVYNLDQKTRSLHIAKGLKRVTHFSWEKMAKETKSVYESSLSV